MSKQITKLFLSGKSMGTKPLMLDDTLIIVREKIKDKVKAPFLFLDKDEKDIKNEEENNFKLEDISKEKIIKLKEDDSQISVFFDESQLCFLKYNPSQKLDETRKLLSEKNKIEFKFLDSEETDISENDEPDYGIEDILKDKSIKLKSKTTSIATVNETTEKNMKKNIKKRKINYDFSKYEIIKKKRRINSI